MSLSSLTRPVFAPLSLIVLFWLEDLFSLRSVSLKQSLLLLSYIIVSDCQLSHVLVNGPTSKRPASDDGLCSGQLLVMWSAVCSGSPHSHVAMSTRPHFFMDALYRQILVRSLFRVLSPVFSTQIFSLDAFSWVRYTAVYSGGSGCFPLLLPRCRNPCILRPVTMDDN